MSKKLYFTLVLLMLDLTTALALDGSNYVIKPKLNSSLFSLGGTYDSMSSHPTSTKSCLKAAINPDNFVITNPVAGLEFTQAQSLDVVHRALGVEFTAQFGFGPFSVSTSYNFAQSSQDDNYTLNLNYIYQCSGKLAFKPNILTTGNSELTPEALAALSSPYKFRALCGDRYISQLDSAASLLIRLSLSFDSRVDKSYFDENLSKVGGLQNILALINSNTSNIHFKLNAAGVQVGGDPQLLNQVFIQNGGFIGKDGYPTLDCGDEKANHTACSNLIYQIINYAQTINQQLTRTNNFQLMNPATSSWDQLGIDSVPVFPDPNVIQAMHQLSNQNSQDYQDLNFLKKFKNMLSSKGKLTEVMQQNLDILIENYQSIMRLYSDPESRLIGCFNGFISNDCLVIRDNFIKARSTILSDSHLNQLLDYLKNNQYLVSLTNSPSLNRFTECLLSPTSTSNAHLFMLDCDSQVSGVFQANSTISLLKATDGSSITVNDFNYNFNSINNTNSNYSYQFNQALQPDSLNQHLFAGIALIRNLNSNTSQMQNVTFTSIYY